MSAAGILRYCARALGFAAAACALLSPLWLRRPRRLRALLCVAYLAALTEITVIRGGAELSLIFAGGRDAPRLVPLQTTLGELRAGACPFLYHTLGNLAWFIPLGVIFARRPAWTAAAAGALLSLCIECLQYLLRTGVTDVDDLLLNALGALAGWALARAWRALRAN